MSIAKVQSQKESVYIIIECMSCICLFHVCFSLLYHVIHTAAPQPNIKAMCLCVCVMMKYPFQVAWLVNEAFNHLT